jgi:formiminotetrahydrofolate cyclodeaminase
MKLAAMTLTEFSETLYSDAPAPGGGSAAALEGVLGASLVGMVAGLTIGKQKYEEHEALMQDIAVKAEALRIKLLDIIDRDTEAFDEVADVFKMPKETDDQKSARKKAMQAALKKCTLVPYETMCCSLEALELAESALGKFNSNAASDIGVAALSLKAAAQGAWLNILININGIEDAEFTSRYRSAGELILEKALSIADEVYNSVRDSL